MIKDKFMLSRQFNEGVHFISVEYFCSLKNVYCATNWSFVYLPMLRIKFEMHKNIIAKILEKEPLK